MKIPTCAFTRMMLRKTALMLGLTVVFLEAHNALAQSSVTITTTFLANGVVGNLYSDTVKATGGVGAYRWSIVSGSLPPPLLLNANTGEITADSPPTTPGTFSFRIRVTTLPTLQTDEKNLSITIVPVLVMTTSSLPAATATVAYSQGLSATGGVSPYTWTLVSGLLPAGLGLSGTNGSTISGTPTTVGTSTFTLRVTDNGTPPQSVQRQLSIRVDPPPLVITTTTLPNGTVGAAYSATLVAGGGISPYTWALASGSSLPAGLSLSNGTIAGTPTTAGTTNFTVVVTDSGTASGPSPNQQSVQRALSIQISPPPLSIITTTLPTGTVGTAYSATLVAAGGTPPYTWTVVSGSLPAGLGLTGQGGQAISGTPTTAGTSTFTIRVSDSGSQTNQKSVVIQINAPPLVMNTSSLPSGTVGGGYSQPLSATGGILPYTWTVVSGSGSLPAGLGISGGGIVGTPTSAGTSNFTLQVADSSTPQQTAQRALSIQINPSGLSITTSSLASGVVGASYSQTLSATGGTLPYTWSIASGSLPAGLGISGGGIGGIPTTAGTSSFTLQVTDSASSPQTAQKALTIQINAAGLSITTTGLPSGTIGTVYFATLVPSGGTAPYTWTIVSGSLPTGLALSGANITGTPTTTGTSNFTVQVTDTSSPAQTAQKALIIVVNPSAVSITTNSPLPSGTVGTPYSQNLTASGGTAPYGWSVVSGALPAGLALNGSSIQGTPTTAGTSNFSVLVSDSSASVQTVQKALALVINPGPLSITTSSLPEATVNQAYNQTLQLSGGTSPFTWSIASGSPALPAGLSLNVSNGTISGTPSTATASPITVSFSVTDSGSPRQTATRQIPITVLAVLTITSTSPLPVATTGSTYSQQLTVAGGTPPYTWSVSSGTLPSGISLGSSNGVLSGTPNVAQAFNFTVRVVDSSSPQQNTTQALALTIGTPLSITTGTPLPAGNVTVSYSQNLLVSGGASPYTWTIVSGQLPPGLNLSTAGAVSGSPTTEGNFNFTARVTDSAAPARTLSKAFDLHIDPPPSGLRITTLTLPTGIQNQAYLQQLSATGGPTPYTWSLTSGTWPAGLSLTAAGVLQGIPTATGSSVVRVMVRDSTGTSATRDYTVNVGPTFGSLTLNGVQAAVDPTRQLPLTLTLSTAYPMDVAGTLNITFTPSAVIQVDDPTLQFSTSGRSVSFTFPANTSDAVFPASQLLLMTGSVSGTLTISANIQNGPANVGLAASLIRSLPPQFSSIVASRVGGGLRVQIIGYSPERRVTNVDFGFDVKVASGTQRVSVPKAVESDFSAWYRDATSTAFGSSFLFDQLFGVQGDASLIQAVTVTLTNGQGSNTSAAIPIP